MEMTTGTDFESTRLLLHAVVITVLILNAITERADDGRTPIRELRNLFEFSFRLVYEHEFSTLVVELSQLLM